MYLLRVSTGGGSKWKVFIYVGRPKYLKIYRESGDVSNFHFQFGSQPRQQQEARSTYE